MTKARTEEENKITKRVEWLEQYRLRQIKRKEVAERLGVSERQVKRLMKRYLEEGVNGLYHKGENNENNAYNRDYKAKILGYIKTKYYDCGPSYATELLQEEDGLFVNRETLRLWMREEKLMTWTRKREPYRKRRDRKEAFGEMLQIDGCFDHWFGKDSDKTCIINLIDDATSKNMCYMDEEETIRAAVIVLWEWIQKYGIPRSIYADRRNAYINTDLMETNNFFGQMCKNLQIRTIAAFTPQAKGRVERSNQTHQRHLKPLLRLREIATIEEANKYIKQYYLPKHNRKTSIDVPLDVHRKLPKGAKLDDYAYEIDHRKVNNDWTVKYKGKTYQILKRNFCPAKSTVYIKQTFSGSLQIEYKGEKLTYVLIKE